MPRLQKDGCCDLRILVKICRIKTSKFEYAAALVEKILPAEIGLFQFKSCGAANGTDNLINMRRDGEGRQSLGRLRGGPVPELVAATRGGTLALGCSRCVI